PGTRHISVGGAIASDVHGKNHHHAGTFGDYVTEIKLMLGSGDEVRCSRDEHAALFRSTVGGMGLTGVILEAKLRLQRVASAGIMQTTIKLPGLDALLEAFDSEANHSYSVAWIDCASQGDALGRSLLILGEHEMEGGLVTQTRSELAVPSAWPGTTMNRTSARLLNALHYRRAPRGRSTRSIDLHRFFYPLDALADWNRLYGHQ